MDSKHLACGKRANSLCVTAIVPANTVRRGSILALTLLVSVILLAQFALGQAQAIGQGQTKFKRIPTQFIAALGDPNADSGGGAQNWGLWRVDPGPRGVWLRNYRQLENSGGIAPAQWKFDRNDWWVEENGLIMEQPDFPVPPGKYVVTGDREAMTVLTVHPQDANGDQRWELDDGVSLYDVTHLPCRSARYTPVNGNTACSPSQAQIAAFPVTPGATMPPVAGCHKQDYAVLFVIGVAIDN